MKLKERKKITFPNYLKRILNFIRKAILSRKTKIFFGAIVIIILFLTGTLFGLLISGFFGTLDNPSQRALHLAHYLGISNLREVKSEIESIAKENIKIPFNYLSGQFSNPKKIFINIGFTDYKKIEYKRQQALEKEVLISSGEDYVPAKIREGDKEISVKMRLKGDWVDQLEGEKWSFRIKTKGEDTLFGMKSFSIQNPETRNYISELVYHNFLKKEGVLGLRYEFIEVVINGENKGIYALEEHFEKQLIEHNNRRESVIIKFNDDLMWEEIIDFGYYLQDNIDFSEHKDYEEKKDLEWFYNSHIETFTNSKILEDPALSKQFGEARNLLESFRGGSLKTHEVFDVNKLAKYFAISTIMGAHHGTAWNNVRFYYNPITSRLEPIGFDGHSRDELHHPMEEYLPDSLCEEKECFKNTGTLNDLIFRDKIFFEKYIEELVRISQKSYLDSLFLDLNEDIEKSIKIIHKDNPFYHFSTEMFYRNAEQIRERLNASNKINVYFQKSLVSQNKIILDVGNLDLIPLEIINIVYNDSIIFGLIQRGKIIQPKASLEKVDYQKFEFEVPENFIWEDRLASKLKINYKVVGGDNIKQKEVLPWSYTEEEFVEEDFMRRKPNIQDFEWLVIDEKTKSISIKKGLWKLNQSLIIPEGYTILVWENTIIDLTNNATILSYSNLQFSGTKENPIKIVSSDGTGQGLAVLNANKTSVLKHVVFSNHTSPLKEGWELTGAITFYESPVKLENVFINEMNSEDGLNIVNSKFEIKNSVLKNCFSDCFDSDFSNGIIKSSSFINCGNDGLDFSGGISNITDIEVVNVGDKGISVGEEGNLTIEKINIRGDRKNKSYIAIASKDQSNIFVEDIQISNAEYGFAIYQKKSEFGPASINAANVSSSNINNEYLIEKGSNFLINGTIIISKDEEIYEKLYGEKFK